MKKSTLFLLGTLITGMAFSLVLAGCATTGGTEDPTAAAQAEQLSADINKISAESATVNNATVTLTNEVRIETVLTVPEGVILDLTKEALQLANNATLIVDGTVNAKAGGTQKVPGTILYTSAASLAPKNGGQVYFTARQNRNRGGTDDTLIATPAQ